jgi:hypothetical protein
MVALVEIHCLSPKVARLMVLVAVKTSSAVERQLYLACKKARRPAEAWLEDEVAEKWT